MKALVTGGAGFIGSEVVRQLAGEGSSVIALDNLANGRWENIAGVPGRRAQVDVRDRDAVRPLLVGVDCILHLACLGVRHSIHSPRENHEVNASATLQLLDMAREAGVARFVYVSSSEVYGTARHAPMGEDHPTFPMTVYGGSKLAAEAYTRAYHRTYGCPTVVVRPFNTYGPCCHHEGDSGEVIPKFLLRGLARRPLMVFGDGSQTRDFTYVTDTAAGIIAAARSETAVGRTINLGQGQEVTIADLARQVGEVLGIAPQVVHDAPRPGDVLRLCADTSLARELLGFHPRVALREGLLRLLEWYRSLGVPPETLLEAERVRNWEVPDGA